MGRLRLPTNSQVYLDASIVIYSVEKVKPYWPLLRPLWARAQAGEITLLGSELLLLETLVKPVAVGDALLADTFRQLLTTSPEVNLVPIIRPILERAAHLRAEAGLKTPDAIHAATALETNCDVFLTNDAVFRRISRLKVEIVQEVLSR